MLMNTTTLIPYNYESAVITFTGDAYVNLTELCAAFDTAPAQFLRLESTKRFLIALAADTGLSFNYADSAQLKTINEERGGLLVTMRGRHNSGTWAHPDLALECARWLSPEFAIWTNRIIRGVLAGVSEADHAYAARLEAEKQTKWASYLAARARAYVEADVPGNVSIRVYSIAAGLPLERHPAANVGGLCKLWAAARRLRLGFVRQQTGKRSKRSLVATYPPALIEEAWRHFGFAHEQPALAVMEDLWRAMLPIYHRLNAAPLALA